MNIIVQIPNICNLNCPYCYSRPVASKDLIDVDRWWNGLSKIPKWPHFWNFNYGEPTLDPGCMEIALRFLERGDDVAFLSNLTNGIEKLKDIPVKYKEKFHLPTSYHPYYWDINSFISEIKKYKDNGFNCNLVQIVAYPPYIPYIIEWKKQLEDNGLLVWVLAFSGIYNNIQYPDSYTDKEKTVVYGSIQDSCSVSIDMKNVGNRISGNKEKITRKCSVGIDFMTINFQGTAYSCHELGDKGILGNIDDGIIPLDDPIICEQDRCMCHGMWGYIIEEN